MTGGFTTLKNESRQRLVVIADAKTMRANSVLISDH